MDQNCRRCGLPTDTMLLRDPPIPQHQNEVTCIDNLRMQLKDALKTSQALLSGAEQRIAELERQLAEERKRREDSDAKWRRYEQEYILPCFGLAASVGIDLRQEVIDQPGKNCVAILFDKMRHAHEESEAGAAAMRKTLDDIADGQFPTPSHLEREGDEARDYRKMAQDALDACAAGADLLREVEALRELEKAATDLCRDPNSITLDVTRVRLSAVAESRKPR